jgi:hypothetical protein
MPIREGSAQAARLEKMREYLRQVLDGSLPTVEAEEVAVDDEGRLIEVGEPWRIKRAQTRPLPRGLVLVKGNVRIKGKLCGPGSVIDLSTAHGPLEAGTYMLLRVLAREEAPEVPVEIELYGGPGYLRAKSDKDGNPKWFAKHRTVKPEAFSRARPARPAPDPALLDDDDDDTKDAA